MSNAESEHQKWQTLVDEKRGSYPHLLLMSVNKINRIHSLLQSHDSRQAVCREIGDLFSNSYDAQQALQRHINDVR